MIGDVSMKRSWLWFVFVFSAVRLCASQPQGANLIPNGGFEIAAAPDGLPDDWQLEVYSRARDFFMTCELSLEAHSGR